MSKRLVKTIEDPWGQERRRRILLSLAVLCLGTLIILLCAATIYSMGQNGYLFTAAGVGLTIIGFANELTPDQTGKSVSGVSDVAFNIWGNTLYDKEGIIRILRDKCIAGLGLITGKPQQIQNQQEFNRQLEDGFRRSLQELQEENRDKSDKAMAKVMETAKTEVEKATKKGDTKLANRILKEKKAELDALIEAQKKGYSKANDRKIAEAMQEVKYLEEIAISIAEKNGKTAADMKYYTSLARIDKPFKTKKWVPFFSMGYEDFRESGDVPWQDKPGGRVTMFGSLLGMKEHEIVTMIGKKRFKGMAAFFIQSNPPLVPPAREVFQFAPDIAKYVKNNNAGFDNVLTLNKALILKGQNDRLTQTRLLRELHVKETNDFILDDTLNKTREEREAEKRIKRATEGVHLKWLRKLTAWIGRNKAAQGIIAIIVILLFLWWLTHH